MDQKIYQQEIEDWDQNARFYDNENEMAYQEKIYRKTMYDFYGIKDSDIVLEAGGGVIKLDKNTILVDFSPKMIEFCKKINKPEKCILASTHELPFANEYFDVVVANGLFHHVKVQGLLEASVKEFYRVLKPGGKICIFDRASNLFPRLFFKMRKPLKKIYKPNSTCSTRNEVDFTDEDIARIENLGFKVEKRKFVINVFFQAMVIFANGLQYLFGKNVAKYWQKTTWPLAYLIEKIFPFKVLCAEQIIVLIKK